MSDHPIQLAAGDNVTEGPPGLRAFVTSRFRAPTAVRYSAGPPETVTYSFAPDLTPQEAISFAGFVTIARGSTVVPLSSREAIQPAIDTLRAFRQRQQPPTNAQVVAAMDAVIDVLRVLFRDG